MAGTDVPESRQLMINLMYLVLTALLALNVTREVLLAFNTMNESINRSNVSIDNKSKQIYSLFEQEMTTADSLKVKPWYKKALEIQSKTEGLMAYIDGWKDSLIIQSGGYELDPKTGDSIMAGMDDINTAYNLFVLKGNGEKMRSNMQEYIAHSLSLIDSQPVRQSLEKQFPLQVNNLPKTEENPSGDWSYGTFHNIPVVAGVAMLSKFQNDIKNSESMILEYFQSQIHAQDYKFNALTAIAVPNTTYALEGQNIKATILLAAYNKDATGMSITSTAGNVPVKDGVGELEFKASGVGTKTVNGTISIEKAGVRESHPFQFDYTVGTAGASLQLDKMNVMYIGVPNPMTLSASGYNIEDVSLHFSGDNAKGLKMTPGEGKGQYSVDVTTQGTIDYSITAKNREGGTAQVGGGKIRVKRIPDPVAEVAGISTGLVKSARAKAEMGVNAALKNFDFEARFVVTGFEFIWQPQNGQPLIAQNDGAIWSPTVAQYIKRSQPGDKWIISNVKAIGPDKQSRSINSIVITLN